MKAYKGFASPRDELTERLCHAYHDQFVSDTPPGNAAAMREALENLLDEAEHGYEIRDAPVAGAPGERQTYHVVDAEYIIDTARASLSAPARNCDRFECAEEAWIHYCDEQGQASDRSWKALILFGKWLFATAKPETKGEVNGRTMQ